MNKIKALRLENDLSQRALAKKSGAVKNLCDGHEKAAVKNYRASRRAKKTNYCAMTNFCNQSVK